MATGAGLSDTGRPGVAAFDFDGTLVDGDSLAPFLWRCCGPTAALRAAVAAPAMAAGYRDAGRSGAKAALLARLLHGADAAHVAAVGEAFGRDLAGRVRPAMRDRLEWHRAQGHHLVLVSASLTAYLDTFAELAGLDHVIATRLEVAAGGTLTGRLVGANVRGAEKAARLRAHLAERFPGAAAELWAYGDSAGDDELLAMADHPTRV